MSKKINFFIFLFATCYFYGQDKIEDTSKFVAHYKLIYQQDSTDIHSKREKKMVLLIGKKYSLFLSENNRFNDSLISNLSKNKKYDPQMAVNRALISRKKTRFTYKIYKNKNNLTVFDKIFSDKFVYNEYVKLNWKISKDTKVINTYLCQKATTTFAGRNYIAWFTNKIPINDGPYKFNGLPGLIVKIYDIKKQYTFLLEGFEEDSSSFSLKLKGIQNITKKEYFKAYNNFKKDIIGQLGQRGISFDKANSLRVKQSIKRSRNNEIELKFE